MNAGEGRRTFFISIYHGTYHGFIMDYHELDNKCIYL